MIRDTASKLSFAVLCLSLTGAVGCRKSSVLSTTAVAEPAGANCATGGLAVRTGDDLDNDNVVSEAEAITTYYVCNGTAGAPGTEGVTSLTKVTPEPVGTNCAQGGYLLETGRDANGNDTLEPSEVSSSEYLCAPASTTANLVLLNKTFIGNADAACQGGYVRIGYGVDANGDGMLSGTEQTSAFVTCNLLPRLTSDDYVAVPDCTQSPIVLPITSVDLDGRVTQTTVQVLSSGSQLVFSSGPNGEVRLSPGAHVGGATLEVTLTDDLGATSIARVWVSFSGTGCTPVQSFHGVLPPSCIAVEISDLAGDDRSGPVLTRKAVYYNGDYGLIRTDLELGNLVQLIERRVDVLLGDAIQGRLLALWSSEWDAVLPDGGTGPGITGLLDPDAGDRFGNWQSPEPLDQLVVLDETSFRPTARFALPQPIAGSSSSFDVTASDGGVITLGANQILLAASDGKALIARNGSNQLGERGVLYQLIDTTSGAVTVSRALFFEAGDATFTDFDWNSQEDNPQHYALHKRGTQYVLTYLNSSGWKEIELSAGQPVTVSSTFASDCDVQNLALGPNLSTVYFHAESGCFGFQTNESLLRCDTLYTSNLDGGIDDRGTTEGGGEVQ